MKKFKMPLIKDHHTHPSFCAALLDCPDIRQVSEKEEALSMVDKEIQDKSKDIAVILGWNNSKYDFSKKELKDEKPMLLCNTSLHHFMVNDAFKECFANHPLGISENIEDLEWVERNLPAIIKFISKVKNPSIKKIKQHFQNLLEQGIWYSEDMLLPGNEVLESYQASGLMNRTVIRTDIDTYNELPDEAKKLIKGIKLFTDGALGSKTAALEDPFKQENEKDEALDNRLTLYTDEELKQSIVNVMQNVDKPIAIHAIGNRVTSQVVRVLKQIEAEYGKVPEVRLEHCQFISLEVAKEAKKLGVKLSMQPNFNTDSQDYIDRLPDGYVESNNPFRMLIDEAGYIPGEDMFFSTDGMPHDPKYLIKAVLFTPFKGQKLTIDELIAGYCVDDEKLGCIEVTVDEDNKEVGTEVILSDDFLK